MKDGIMTKVGELLDMAGLDEEVIKAVTEKLENEEVEVLETCQVDQEDAEGEGQKDAPVDKKANVGGEKGGKNSKVEGEKEAPVSEADDEDEDKKEEAADEEKEEEPKKPAAKKEEEKEDKKEETKGDDEVEVADDEEDEKVEEALAITEALEVLLEMVKEARAEYLAMSEDFEALKREYASMIAESIIEEALAEEEIVEEEFDEEEVVEESLDEVAERIAQEVTGISEAEEVEEIVEEEVKPSCKAYSAFSSLNESEEEKPSARKAFTLFPNL